TGGINYPQTFYLSPGSDCRRNTVGAENDHCPCRDLVDLIHKDGSLGGERLDHVLVMDNLPAHVNGGLEKLEGYVNHVNSPIHTSAESAWLREQNLLEFHSHWLFLPSYRGAILHHCYASRFPLARQKSSDDILAAIHTDDITSNPIGAVVHQGDDGGGHILGCSQPPSWVPHSGKLSQLIDSGDLARTGGKSHARLDGVGGDTVRHQFVGQLADVGLEDRLG